MKTGHVSPQYHVVFDDDFSTVPYLDSSEEPPNWCQLVSDSSEHVTDEQYNVATTWYSGQDADLPTVSNLGSTDGEMREEDATTSSNAPHSDSESSRPTTSQPFVDLSSLGLRRSTRKRSLPNRLTYGLLVMAAGFLTVTAYAPTKMYHGFYSGYDDYLDTSFDGTNNSMSIMGQMYLSGKINNEIYTLKEMMKQPDRKEFEKAMHKEVQAMFENKIWEKVSRKSMDSYYYSLQKIGSNPKRKQIMMI